jgi:thiamine-phosphate diphosphorylase
MFQFITNPDSQYTIPEQVQMAVESGCQWIQLNINADDKESVKLAAEICQEAGVILTVENDFELAKEFGLHGVHMNNSDVTPASLREMLGAEAIIGYRVESTQSAFLFKGLDIDYIALPREFSDEKATEFIQAVRDCQIEIPIVLSGDFNEDNAERLFKTKASGIAGCDSILNSTDPISGLKKLLSKLGR